MATRGRAPAQDPADQRRPLQPGVLRGAAPRHSAARWHIIIKVYIVEGVI